MVKTISEMIVDGIGKFYTQFKSQRILKSKDAVLANTNPDNLSSAIVVKELYNNLKQTFQAGVDALYNRCVSCGATPSAKTPAAVSTAIGTIHTNRYNTGYSAGRTQGQNDVKGAPNSYGLYTGSQYTANYNAGYNAGAVANAVKKITVSWTLNLLPDNISKSGTAIYAKNSNGSWSKSGDWGFTQPTVGGAVTSNGAMFTINSITVE